MNNLFYLTSDIDEILSQTLSISKKLSGKHIVLTGGRGFLGRYFTEYFFKLNKVLKKPIFLTVIDNFAVSGIFGKNIPINDNFKFLNIDASKKFKLSKKVDYFIHAAGIASPYYYRKYPLETLDVAINGVRNILDMAKKDSSKVIFFSSSEIYGDPDPNKVPIKENYRGNVSTAGPRACYDESKRLGETLCYIYNKYYNVNTNVIRPFNVFGPGMQQNDYRILPNFANKIINNEKLLIYGHGNQTRTYCYITDAIVGFLKVILNGSNGETYNIGNPNSEISVVDLFELIKKITDKKIEFEKIQYPKSYPTDEPQRRCPDITKATKDLKYKPAINLENGLKKFFTWTETNYVTNYQAKKT